MPTPQVVWLKRDLRTQDHTALHTSISQGATLALYVLEPDLCRQPSASVRTGRLLLSNAERKLEDEMKKAIQAVNALGGSQYALDYVYPASSVALWHRPENWSITQAEINLAKGSKDPQEFEDSELNTFDYKVKDIKFGSDSLEDFRKKHPAAFAKTRIR